MGLIHLYNSIDNSHDTIKGTGRIIDLLPDVDWNKALLIKEGSRIDPYRYELTDNDVLFVRFMPGTMTALAVIAIVSAVVAVGVGIGAAIYANYMSEETKKKMEKAQRDAENLANTSEQLPFLKGAKNTSALGTNIQFLMGEMLNTPKKLTDGYYTIGGTNGNKQYWTSILSLGYGKQVLKDISVGSVVIKDLKNATEPQNEIMSFDKGSVYEDDENIIEVAQNSELSLDIFKKKVVSTLDGAEIKHDFGADAEPQIRELASHTKKVEVCIQFNELRKYNTSSSTWEARAVKVVPYWSNDNGTTWNEFVFNFPYYQTEKWVTLSRSEINQAIAEGKITWTSKPQSTYPELQMRIFDNNMKITACSYGTISSEKFWYGSAGSGSSYPTVKKLEITRHENDNMLSLNTRSTVRFIAEKEFSWNDTHDENGKEKQILIKVVKDTPKMESNSREEAYLLYFNSFCYDAKKSSIENGLVDCKPLEDWYTSKCSLMGVRMIANENTSDTLDEINSNCCGVARVWDRDALTWSNNKVPTRNPASWILEVLTSDVHPHSKYSDSEIDLISLGELYEYCEEEEFHTDALLTKGTKKNDILVNILKTVNADMILNEEGKLSFAIDKKESVPVALLNAQSIQSVTVAKSFERKPNGIKVTYTNRENWSIDTFYSMLDGRDYHTVDDILTELSFDYVTDYKHAYKVAQRTMRQQKLQPREIKVKVGKEGDYYPLYSTVKLQLEQLKVGIRSATIHEIHIEDGYLKWIRISDTVEFVSGNSYGVIIQCESAEGRRLLSATVTGQSKTKILVFTVPIPVTTPILPQVNNTLSFGIIENGNFEKITNVMKIVGVSAADEDGIELTLRDYNEAIYEYGEIPEYKTNLTKVPNSSANKIQDININKQLQDVSEQITEVNNKIISAGIVTLTSLDPTGYEDGTFGVLGTQLYKMISGKWERLDEGAVYLGKQITTPEDATIGSFFLAGADFVGYKSLKVNDDLLAVNNGADTYAIGIKHIYQKAYLYMLTDRGWDVIQDRNDWRYILAMEDVLSVGGTVPFYFENFIAETTSEAVVNKTPRYLGGFAEVPVMANKGDWFAYIGETAGNFHRGEVYTWSGVAWVVDTNTDHKTGALDDLLSVTVEAGDGTFATALINKLVTREAFIDQLVSNSAFINSLTSKYLTIQNKGIVKSENYSGVVEDGEIKQYGTEGWAIDHTGKSDFVNINATGGKFSNVSVVGNLESLNGFVFSQTARLGYRPTPQEIELYYGLINNFLNQDKQKLCKFEIEDYFLTSSGNIYTRRLITYDIVRTTYNDKPAFEVNDVGFDLEHNTPVYIHYVENIDGEHEYLVNGEVKHDTYRMYTQISC